MALVQFKTGNLASYVALAEKDANTLYFCEDAGLLYKGSTLYSGAHVTVSSFPEEAAAVRNTIYINTTTGEVRYFNGSSYVTMVKPNVTSVSESSTNAQLPTAKAVYDFVSTETGDLENQISAIVGTNEDTAEDDTINGLRAAINAENTRATGAEQANATAISAETTRAQGVEGSLENLTTTAKTNLVAAINEVKTAAANAQANAAVTISDSTTTAGMLKSYTFTQNGATIGTIDIPKDLVVSSGELIVVDAEHPVSGLTNGTYIKLVIANQTEPIYIDVKDLIDVYTAEQNATQIQLAVNAGVISGEIVDGSVDADALGTDAVTTVKIANANVTKAKLSQAVQDSLDAADTAVQSVVTGTTNGTISVDGSEVGVAGLGTAAYHTVEYFQGETATAQATDATVAGAKKYADSLDAAMDARVDALEAAIGEGGAVEDQITAAIEELDSSVSATSGSVLTGVTITDGKLTNKTELALAAVATTGAAADVSVTDAGNLLNATTVEAALQELAGALTWKTI